MASAATATAANNAAHARLAQISSGGLVRESGTAMARLGAGLAWTWLETS